MPSGGGRASLLLLISTVILLVTIPLGGGDPRVPEVLTFGPAEQAGMSSERLNRLDRVVQDAIAAGNAPGAVVLVARHGTVVYRKAFGRRAVRPLEEAMSLDTLFDMASLTKVMATATSIMILVEEGRISLTDRVAYYIPEFAAEGKEEITLRHLLTHFSGLRPDVDLIKPWQGYETAIQLGVREKLVAPPGERFIYSDINYFLLAEIVRRVSGESIDAFSRRSIFEPLGMQDTLFRPDPERLARIAPTEARSGRMLRGQVHDPTTFRMGGVAGHAGLFSTVDDTAIFAQMILNGGTYNGRRILSPLGVRAMMISQSPEGVADRRGLGFDIRTRFSTPRGDLFPVGSVGHTGFTGTSLWIDPYTDTFLVMLTSRLHPGGKGDVIPLRKKAASVVAASILDVEPIRDLLPID